MDQETRAGESSAGGVSTSIVQPGCTEHARCRRKTSGGTEYWKHVARDWTLYLLLQALLWRSIFLHLRVCLSDAAFSEVFPTHKTKSWERFAL
jgi:hypothetical protein